LLFYARRTEEQKGFMSEKFMFGFFWVHCNGDSSKTKFLFLNIFSWSFYVDLKKGEKRNAKN